MGGEWRELHWGDLVTLEYGKALRGYDVAAGRFRVFGTNGPIGWCDEALCNHPGVVIGRKGAYRGVHYSPAPFFVIDTAFYLEPKTNLDFRWAYYELLTQDIKGLDSGSAIPSTSREAFYSLPVRVPPLEEQRAIAHILGTLDDKIELNRRMSETLEAIARAIFKSWFVDFDPVQAKAEGRDPGLPETVCEQFPSRFKDSELGEIPEGWSLGTLADYADLNPESWSSNNRPKVIKYVDLSNTKWGRIESVAEYLREEAPSRAQRILRPGDTIVGTVRPGNGSYALVRNTGLTGSTGFATLRPKRTEYVGFVYLAATAPDNVETLAHMADGAAYPAVRPEMVAATPVVIPSHNVLNLFSQVVDPLLRRMSEAQTECRTLAALRDTLLPKLISGELRVKNAERFLAKAI